MLVLVQHNRYFAYIKHMNNKNLMSDLNIGKLLQYLVLQLLFQNNSHIIRSDLIHTNHPTKESPTFIIFHY